jgi:Type VI secretion system VasI, EvfG, VC_A0118
MERCPKCGREFESAEALQHVCPDAADLAAKLQPTLPEGSPESLAAALETAHPTPPPAPSSSNRWLVTVGLAASAGAALLTFAMLGGGSQPGPAPEQASMLPAPVKAKSTPVTTSGRPKWSEAGADRWVSNHRRSIAFEVPGENVASSWMTSARPVLVVRCLAGTTQAFVYTQVPPAIEQRDDRRTVRVSFDGETEAVERWPGSADHDALFAPDGIAFARRLSTARTLRFGFTPHNGRPASIDFDVHGFDAHLASLARTCRWKK